MKAVTWRPGSDDLYDPLFHYLRERCYRDRSHPLWNNYNKEHFQTECLALSIVFGDHGFPVFCGSILSRDCWPKNAYRIINRFFATNMWATSKKIATCANGQVVPIDQLAEEQGVLLESQINWLKQNTDVELMFISRESSYWQQWIVDCYRKQFNLEFKYNKNRYQVCSTPHDDSCFQRIIYQGSDELLEHWNHK